MKIVVASGSEIKKTAVEEAVRILGFEGEVSDVLLVLRETLERSGPKLSSDRSPRTLL
jgi:hypothetical protein